MLVLNPELETLVRTSQASSGLQAFVPALCSESVIGNQCHSVHLSVEIKQYLFLFQFVSLFLHSICLARLMQRWFSNTALQVPHPWTCTLCCPCKTSWLWVDGLFLCPGNLFLVAPCPLRRWGVGNNGGHKAPSQQYMGSCRYLGRWNFCPVA